MHHGPDQPFSFSTLSTTPIAEHRGHHRRPPQIRELETRHRCDSRYASGCIADSDIDDWRCGLNT